MPVLTTKEPSLSPLISTYPVVDSSDNLDALEAELEVQVHGVDQGQRYLIHSLDFFRSDFTYVFSWI